MDLEGYWYLRNGDDVKDRVVGWKKGSRAPNMAARRDEGRRNEHWERPREKSGIL